MDRESFRTCTVSYRIRCEFGGGRREARSIILFFAFNCVHIFTLTETKLVELSIEL